MLRKIYKLIFDAEYRNSFLINKGFYNYLSDARYLKIIYKQRVGKKLNLDSPQTFNEKLQWLKIHDRKPQYTIMADKYAVKDYVSSIIGEEYVIPTIGVWETADDIDFAILPNEFVLKCTNDSGGLILCTDKTNLDENEARKKLNNSLKNNYFYKQREWPYKNIVPRIIAEPFMKDEKSNHLIVYKIFTFSGEPYLIQVIQNDKTPYESVDYFDLEWNLLDIRQNYPNSENHLNKPITLNQMLELSKKLSGPSFLRTDFYEINGKVYFSEFTFYSDAGMAAFYPEYWDKKLGDLVLLPELK